MAGNPRLVPPGHTTPRTHAWVPMSNLTPRPSEGRPALGVRTQCSFKSALCPPRSNRANLPTIPTYAIHDTPCHDFSQPFRLGNASNNRTPESFTRSLDRFLSFGFGFRTLPIGVALGDLYCGLFPGVSSFHNRSSDVVGISDLFSWDFGLFILSLDLGGLDLTCLAT